MEKMKFLNFVYDIVICKSLLQAVLRRNTVSLRLWPCYLHNIVFRCTMLHTEIQFYHFIQNIRIQNINT